MSRFAADLLTGRVALVTGASSGLGRHFAVMLARHGADVVVAARRVDALAEVAREIEGIGRKAYAVPLDVRNEAWANKVVAMERVGRFGTDSCSPTGLGGFTGCTQALVAGAKAERQAANKTDWQAMIADERAKRLAGIDAAADEVEAAVVAEEKALAERQKAAEELERQASGQGPAPAASDEADGQPLPTPPRP